MIALVSKLKNQLKGKEMATEKQKLHNNLASLRGVDKFIDFLLLHVDKTMKIQGIIIRCRVHSETL
jgi:hypothetical protein